MLTIVKVDREYNQPAGKPASQPASQAVMLPTHPPTYLGVGSDHVQRVPVTGCEHDAEVEETNAGVELRRHVDGLPVGGPVFFG